MNAPGIIAGFPDIMICEYVPFILNKTLVHQSKSNLGQINNLLLKTSFTAKLQMGSLTQAFDILIWHTWHSVVLFWPSTPPITYIMHHFSSTCGSGSHKLHRKKSPSAKNEEGTKKNTYKQEVLKSYYLHDGREYWFINISQAGRTSGYIGLAFSYSDLPIGTCDHKNFWTKKINTRVIMAVCQISEFFGPLSFVAWIVPSVQIFFWKSSLLLTAAVNL